MNTLRTHTLAKQRFTIYRTLSRQAHRAPTSPITTLPVYATRSFSQHNRMSSDAPKKEWLCHIPDHPNQLENRKAIRPEHLEKLKPNIENRTVVLGGAVLSKHPEEGEGPDMTGSFLIVQAETRGGAVDFLKSDVYSKKGVWNVDAATIWPFKSAVRTQL